MTLVLITGASSGLGLEIAKACARSSRAYTIILSGRSPDKVQEAIKIVKAECPDSKSQVLPLQLDVEDDEEIDKAFQIVDRDHGKLDILVNNAGASLDNAMRDGRLGKREGWAKSWDLNVTSAHLLTEKFVPLLIKSKDPRLLFITSGTASCEENQPGSLPVNASPPAGWPKPNLRTVTAYRSAKVGLNMLMREWARLLREDKVKVWAVAPGFLATGLGDDGADALRKMGAKEPHVGGESVLRVIEGHRDDNVDLIVRHYGTPIQPF